MQKLYLKEGMTLLDIGLRLGASFLLKLRKNIRSKGQVLPLSHEQYEEFQRRIKAEGLEDYLTVELMDYRDLANSGKTFDRVVSVGMVEHVGRDNYQLFYGLCQQSLKRRRACSFFILSAPLKEHPGDAWIKKVYFPRRYDPPA